MSEDHLPSTISTFISADLRKRIVSGDLEPGQALREEEIRDRYGSSRGPIRESLRLLLQTGLVEHQPRRGFKVRSYTAEDIQHIYRLRAKLEGFVVEELAERQTDALIADLTASCETMGRLIKRKDLDSYFAENARFHQMMIDVTENRPLTKVLEYVNEISLPVRRRLLSDPEPLKRSLAYHRRIVALIAAGEIDEAKALTEHHILENLERAVAEFAPATMAAAAAGGS